MLHSERSSSVPAWAVIFLNRFPWDEGRLQAFLSNVLFGVEADEPTVVNCDMFKQEDEEMEEESFLMKMKCMKKIRLKQLYAVMKPDGNMNAIELLRRRHQMLTCHTVTGPLRGFQ